MDAKELAARVLESRRATLPVGGMSFAVVLPTDLAVRLAASRHRNADGVVMEVAVVRELLADAITGWEGLTVGHVLPEGGEEPLPYSADNKQLLLESRQDIADELAVMLAEARAKRAQRLETARKN